VTRLGYIELERFRSFRKKVRIEFPERGLVRIRGRNLDTGGESGAGKSTIALGINYAWGCCPFPATELQSWGSDSVPSVALSLRDDAALVERGKRFNLTVAGEQLKGSAAQKEEWLARLFGGYDMDMVLALTYRGQKKPGLFLSKTDSQKKEFLTRLLGLDKFERGMEATAANIRDLKIKVERAEATVAAVARTVTDLGPAPNLEALKAEEDTLREEIVGLEALIASMRGKVDGIKADGELKRLAEMATHTPLVAAAQEAVREVQAAPPVVGGDTTEVDKWTKVFDEAQKRLERLTSDDRARQKALIDQRDTLLRQQRTLARVAAEVPSLLREKARLATELESLAADFCPTCEREWDRAQAQRDKVISGLKEIDRKLDECADAESEVARIQGEVDTLPRFEPDPKIARMQKVQSDARASAASAHQKLAQERLLLDSERRHKLAEAQADLAMATNNQNAACSRATAEMHQDLQKLQRDIDLECVLHAQLRRTFDDVMQNVYHARATAQQREKLADQLAQAEVELTSQHQTLHAEEDFMALIGREGFLGLIFEEILAEISDETNQLLASVANTRHCTLRFDSETTTQKGTVRKEIKPVVTIHGYEAGLESGPSGGMYSVIELAVDLALGAVISRRTGLCPGWLILDESFDGLGAVEKESALEILQRYAAERLVLVIDHTSEFQGAFAQSVTVEYSEGDSWLCTGGPKCTGCRPW
jgi:DNA repair exonuclease SbcCD ATPase subunit